MATATAAPRRALRGTASIPMWPAIRTGFYGGLAYVFVSTIGLVEGLGQKNVIDPILSLGYTVLVAIGLFAGYVAGRAAANEREPANPLLYGVVAGLSGGVLATLYLLWINNFEVRDIFTNISPKLIDLLNLQQDVGTGVLLAVGGGVILGALGAGLVLLSPLMRRALVGAMLWVLVVGFLEVVLSQILRELDLGVALAFAIVTGAAWAMLRAFSDRPPLLVGGMVVAMVVGVVVSQLFSEISLGLSFIPDWVYVNRVGGRAPRWPAALVVFALAFAVTVLTEDRRRQFRSRLDNADPTEKQRWAYYGIALFVGLGVFLPMILGTLVNELLATTGLFLLMGLGLNIVIGYAGMLDLGYVAFFAVGAYTTAILTSTAGTRDWAPELSFWEALPFVIIAATIAGILVGTPVIRMRGDYLAIVTLGFGEIARILFLSDWFTPVTGGAQGVTRIPPIELGFYTVKGTNQQAILYMILVFVALAAFVSWRLQDSRIGRSWMAMREDEQVAETMGVNIVQAKLLAFVVGANIAAVGGALFAVKFGTIFPASFSIIVSITVLVLIIVGGMGNIPGVAVGALVMIGVLGGRNSPGLLREFAEFKLLIYGALLLYMMLRRPEGLLPSKQRSRELHQDEALQDAWLRAELDKQEATS